MSTDDGTFASDVAWADALDGAHIAARHTCELVERHRIEILLDDTAALNANERTNVARARAMDWARAHGLEIKGTVNAISGSVTRPGTAYNGVVFDVIVGKGDIAVNQTEPGVLDAWRWSGRFEWWRKVFNRMDGRQGRHLAEVRSIRTSSPITTRMPANIAPAVQIAPGGTEVPPWQRNAMDRAEDEYPTGEGLPPGLR